MGEIDNDKIIEKLKEKCAINSCPRCNAHKFSIAGTSYLPLIDKPGDITLGGQNVPVVLVACENCGFISQHALGAFGLLNKDINEAS